VASSCSETSDGYFREGLAAGAGGLRVVRRNGVTDLIAGSRYCVAGTRLRAEVVNDTLQVIYLGEVLREYTDWVDYTDQIRPQDYPLGGH
jgi:hypothetical protein